MRSQSTHLNGAEWYPDCHKVIGVKWRHAEVAMPVCLRIAGMLKEHTVLYREYNVTLTQGKCQRLGIVTLNQGEYIRLGNCLQQT